MYASRKDTGWRWLDRHVAGWGVVRLIRQDSRTVATVHDPEMRDEYPAAVNALHVYAPRELRFVSADEAVGIGGAR